MYNVWNRKKSEREEYFDDKTTIEMIRKYKETQDISYRNKVVENCLGMIKYMVNKYASGYSQFNLMEDIYQHCCIKMIQLIDKFDINKSDDNEVLCAYWKGFIQIALINEVRQYNRNNKNLFNESSIYKPIGNNNGDDDEICIMDKLIDCEDVQETVIENIITQDKILKIKDAIEYLSPKDQEYAKIAWFEQRHDGKPYTQLEIADIMCSRGFYSPVTGLPYSQPIIAKTNRRVINKLKKIVDVNECVI